MCAVPSAWRRLQLSESEPSLAACVDPKRERKHKLSPLASQFTVRVPIYVIHRQINRMDVPAITWEASVKCSRQRNIARKQPNTPYE
jgi:hypothetical protein